MDVEKLKGPVYFLGFCVLFAGCTVAGDRDSLPANDEDYHQEMQDIKQELQILNQQVKELNVSYIEDDGMESTPSGPSRSY
ncbi:hypothetical protein [Halobacillus litoralis]|uniref:hypothetical protein n=1 Tax=Halobacillus litoralis TaxID=45668 RepID=UPI001CFEB6B8|nr:hypothetical protein [Halobacillus litoralis]